MVTKAASAAIAAARALITFPASSVDHRRGVFPATAVGVSFGGGGQQVPGNLVHPDNNRAVLDALLPEKSITWVAHFGSGERAPCFISRSALNISRFF